MRLEKIDNDYYKVFINSGYIDEFDINNNGELGKYIKKIILKIRKIYNMILEGFYEVHVYILKHLGMILEIKNIDSYLSKTIDLKIIVHNDEEIYLQIPEYELLEEYKNFKYLNNSFYLNANNIKERDVFKVNEHYKLIYGDCLNVIKREWCDLTK